MQPAKLVLLCLAAICGFAAVLGEVSAWICPEAFLLGKPRVFGNWPAALLGPLWGVLDFLLPAVIVGVAVALAANVGERPAVKAFFFRKPMLGHVGLMTLVSTAGGIIGWYAVKNGAYEIVGPMAAALPAERHGLLGAVWWAALGAHAANFAGGIAITGWIWKKRVVFEQMVRVRPIPPDDS